MKKIIFMAFFVCASIYSFAQENDIKFYRHSMQTNAALLPIELLLNAALAAKNGNFTDEYIWAFNFEYQHSFTRYLSFSLIPTFGFTGVEWYQDRSMKTHYYYNRAFGLMIGLDVHPQGNWLKGWWIGIKPIIGINQIETDVADTLWNFGFMVTGGYNWILGNGFTIGYWFGAGNSWFVPFGKNKYEWEKEHLFGLPFDFGGNLSIGYSF